VRTLLLVILTLVIVSVHGIAPGSSRFCLMKTSPACQHKAPATAEISAPDCCSDGCMKGTKIDLPSTDLSVRADKSLKSLNPDLLIQIIAFNWAKTITAIQKQTYAQQSGAAPPSLGTQLAKLQIFLI